MIKCVCKRCFFPTWIEADQLPDWKCPICDTGETMTMEHTKEENEICIKCQECCNWMTFTVVAQSLLNYITAREYYEARGCKIVGPKFGGGVHSAQIAFSIMVPLRCPHLTDLGCDIYERRPQLCGVYDGRMDPFLKDVCQLPKEKSDD